VVTILWQDLTTGALDRCQLAGVPGGGVQLSGTVLTPGTPLQVSYRVQADQAGHTRVVDLALDHGDGLTAHTLLAYGDGRWGWAGGPDLDAVAGAVDVDLTVTPATNTLPIRRLAGVGLEVGDAADLRMAWVQFPGLEVIPSDQRYERLADDRWLFSTGDFAAELVVDLHGLVIEYGGLFRAVAYHLG
jgi:hypothetical protein